MKPLRDSPVRRRLLQLLREKEYVSGEDVARECGVSRIAVWKHVKELNELGYTIESTPRGYRLVSEADVPYPWELDVRAYYFPVTPSTMDEARKLAEKEQFAFVIAGQQSSGRGRVGRGWESPPGGLYFSLILRPRLPLERVRELSIRAAEAVAGVIGDFGIEAVADKGDVFVRGRKIAGTLVEAFGETDMVRFAILGVGVNVNNPVPQGATSLSMELGRRVSLLGFARRLFDELVKALQPTPF